MKIITKKEVVAKTRLSTSTINRMVHAGKFPKPIQLGAKRSAWIEEDIDKWIKNLTRGLFSQDGRLVKGQKNKRKKQ
jgi:prophage regulatory protein